MRVQKSKQLLRELEGGEELYGSVGHLSDGEGVESNPFAPTGHSSKHNVIAVKDMEVLGPDYCLRKPVFLPHHFRPIRSQVQVLH